MTRQEFESLATTVTDPEFETIDFVYTYHPSIDEVRGKQQIAELYLAFKMRVILDMAPTARKAKELEDRIRQLIAEIEGCRTQLSNLTDGL